ncbi:MAG: cation:dicarboxylase symporter family transporter [Sphingobacteriales bacterium]|nr:MAG: cation:dicarboxylase symporter family transporter [Sphingobacteriales bacterium]
MKKNKVGQITLAVITIAIIITLLYEFNVVPISSAIMMATRWTVAVALFVYALAKRNLTTWILVCMIFGVFVGLDFPNVAAALHPLSKGFIKLVKTIVGPILFGTLVFGIAGHSDLKQVGDQSSLAYPAYARSIAQQAIEIAKPPYEASEVIQPYWLPAACTSSIDHLKPLRDT